MSSASTPSDSPASVHIQPLHNPQNAAHVAVPQAPLGNATNGPISHAPGMGARALLVKRMSKTQNPAYVSPTDNLLTPATQKISAAKKKHFNRGKPTPTPALFSDIPADTSDNEDSDTVPPESSERSGELATTDDNPF
ncbi:hypothetical protein BJV78DRAFT_1152021 [Lactifluus subvellereus]|nr:hypothetical protein BJV78DRAFT_1152021 [Lactifluus subvellereus]